MSDLISRKALIDILAKYKFGAIKSESEREYTKETVLNFVKEQSSVTDTNVGGKWVPCSEKMPDKEYELYWTTHEDGSIVLHGYTKKNGFIYNWEVDDLELRKRQGRVVAWMLIPMPEPYKGE